MNIIAVFHDNNIYSGATRSYLTNIEYMKKCGDKILGIIPRKEGDLEKYLNTIGIPTIKVYYGGNVYYSKARKLKKIVGILKCFLKGIMSFSSALYLALKLKKEHYNIVYTNTSTINIGYWISFLLKIKHIWHFREFGYEDQDSLRLFEKSFRKKAKQADVVITISNILNKYYKSKFGLENTIMLYDDLSKTYRNYRIKRDDNNINILVTGTFSEGKGQLIAIKAVELLNNEKIHLYLAGKINTYAKKLNEYVIKRNVKHIHFCGLVHNMNELRSKMDFSIVCSRSEAFGRTIIEDMLSEILVIAAEKGSIHELIENNKNGLLYNYGDEKNLAQVINYAINLGCEKEKIIKSGLEFAENFIHENTAKQIRALLLNILELN